MAPTFESLTLFFPMWNEEEYIERAVSAAIKTDDMHRPRAGVARIARPTMADQS